MNKFLKGPGLWLLVIVLIVMVVSFSGVGNMDDKDRTYQDLMRDIESGNVSKLSTIGSKAVVALIGSSNEANFPQKYDYIVYVPSIFLFDQDVKTIMAKQQNVAVDAISPADYTFLWMPEPEPQTGMWVTTLLSILIPVGLIVFIWFMMMKQSQGGSGKIMSFGKSKARLDNGTKNRKTFADVAGADEETFELQELVDFLKNPKKYLELGARIPKGVLLVGPPGTGKTLLARAVAGEADVPFFSISGSDFVEMFVGVGASRVRDLFEQAKKHAPCIIFVDEIDAVGRHRGAGMGGGNDEREQTLNQLLVELDGFAVNEGVIILAATNRPDILDPALLRPGRFDRQIMVSLPDVRGREEILKIHSKNKPLSDKVNLKVLAKRTPGFTGADLENVMNEAAILAARGNNKKINMDVLEEAITRVIAGPEKKSRVITEFDKRLTAYHEAGHAVVAIKLENADSVHEISIIPRGMTAGYTLTLPDEDKNHVTKSKLEDMITMSMGGRVAEQLVLGDVSTGASQDIKQSTAIARKMVTEYGMSDKIGTILYGNQNEEIFIGRDWGSYRDFSETIASLIDSEVKSIIDTSYNEATRILNENMDKLHKTARILLEQEKIGAEEFIKIMKDDLDVSKGVEF